MTRSAASSVCPTHGIVDAVPWKGALVCPDPECHRTCVTADQVSPAASAPRGDVWALTDAIQMDLRAAGAKLVELRSLLSRLELSPPRGARCDRCGLMLSGEVTLSEHLYVSHDGPVPPTWERAEAIAS